MFGSPPATAQALVQSNTSAAMNTTKSNSPSKLEPSLFDDGDSSWVMMTTDGGNDTGPEADTQEDIDSEESPKKANKTSPKKRAAANTGEEDSSPKKKRAPAKSRVTPKASNGATEIASNDKKKRSTPAKGANSDKVAKTSDNEAVESHNSGTERPSTPEAQTIKEAKTPKTPKTPGSPDSDNIVEANDTTPKSVRAKTHPAKPKAAPKQSPVKGKRAGAEKVAEKVVLPTKWSEATLADRTLVSMKQAGHPWSAIRVKWYEMTGQDTASSTLPNRYKRLQSIMMELEEGDDEVLVAAKEAVEANMKNTLWMLVAAKMEEMGTRKYPTDFLHKEFKKMEAAGTTAPHVNGVYAPTAPVEPKPKTSTASEDEVKAEYDAEAGGDTLLAAAAEAMADESEEGAEEVGGA
ncbi:hypothetical protein XANCAGTX0491_003934 [Xanthoria calcicola]